MNIENWKITIKGIKILFFPKFFELDKSYVSVILLKEKYSYARLKMSI